MRKKGLAAISKPSPPNYRNTYLMHLVRARSLTNVD